MTAFGGITKNAQHALEAVERLLLQFHESTRLKHILTSFANQVQEAEDALWQLLTERVLDVAVGAQLDGIGRIVLLPRRGRTDDVYRVWLRARILVLRSNGRAESLIEIVKTVVPDGTSIYPKDEPPAALTLEVLDAIDEDLGNQVTQLLSDAKGGGIRLLVKWKRAGNVFKYSDTLGTEATGSSFGYGAGEYSAVSAGDYDVDFAP